MLIVLGAQKELRVQIQSQECLASEFFSSDVYFVKSDVVIFNFGLEEINLS